MTKKHFEAIAKAISHVYACYPSIEYKAEKIVLRRLVEELCTIFVEANPRFNKARFLRACRLGQSQGEQR